MNPTDEMPPPDAKWATFKDRLAIALAVVLVLALFFFLIDGAVFNFDCSFGQFVTFECNRWNASGRP